MNEDSDRDDLQCEALVVMAHALKFQIQIRNRLQIKKCVGTSLLYIGSLLLPDWGDASQTYPYKISTLSYKKTEI